MKVLVGGIEDKLAQTAEHERAEKKVSDAQRATTGTVELDGQGRLLLRRVTRKRAKKKGDVEVLGNLDYPGSDGIMRGHLDS